MPKMIYRGFEHDGLKNTVLGVSPIMIYRGARHNGETHIDCDNPTEVVLIYRGIVHAGTPRLSATPKVVAPEHGVVSRCQLYEQASTLERSV
jgi:hypothetical protein